MSVEDNHARFVHRLTVPLCFPAGLAPGAGKDAGNTLVLARGGRDQAVVLRGTAVAGVLRHAYEASLRALREDERGREVERWFGYALGAGSSRHRDRPSPLRVPDAVLDLGGAEPRIRTHNAIDRHTGAVRGKGLFSIEALPPGTRAALLLWIEGLDDEEARRFLERILGLLASGLVFGGSGARGIGRAVLLDGGRYRRFALDSLDDYADWLDESWAWRAEDTMPSSGEAMSPAKENGLEQLEVALQLVVPRGQDICVADGVGPDHALEPQRVSTASGEERWQIPGSSLRGVFRAWVSRLAARSARAGECELLADSVEQYQKLGPVDGDTVGWGFIDGEQRRELQERIAADPQARPSVPCPVMRLFGSLFGAGRIHIADAMSTASIDPKNHTQYRKHVAIDRVTGGANEGFLFEHSALMRGPIFEVKLTVQQPSALEARWLASTIRALDQGLLRVGSSKSAGRLGLGKPPEASGPHHEMFTSIRPIGS